MAATPSSSSADEVQSFLDDAFERAVRLVEEGRTPDVDALLEGRDVLRDDVERLVLLAHQVANKPARTVSVISGYSLLHELGHGGMGSVYLARQESLGGRAVALKVLPASAGLSARARDRFLNEARAIANLRHPNIVAVHDVVHDGGLCAYSMEWVDGASLAAVIDHLKSNLGHRSLSGPTMDDVRTILGAGEGGPPESNVVVFFCRIGLSIARALSAVHGAGLLHRDVKSSNILLRRDGTPLLADFGLVRQTDSSLHTLTGQFAGTVAYAPPEQLRGEAAAVDARSDVYALGVTLYHALTLRLPYEARNPTGMLRKIEAGFAAPLRKLNPRVPRDLETIVAKAMDVEPTRRYQTADDLADDLDRLLSLQSIKARPTGLVTKTIKLIRRNHGRVVGALLGAALTLVLSIAASVYWFIVPEWVSAHVTDARLTLLDPGQGNQVFSVLFFGERNRVNPAASADVLRAALSAYDRALRLAPFDEDIRTERDIVQRAMAIGASAIDRDTGTITDLRLRGLQAFLIGDITAALDAWSRLDLHHDPDAFVEAALGILHLANGEPGRAYPRLRNAQRSYANVGYLTVYLADAALQCGDIEKARQWLDAARDMPRLDPWGGWFRVQADWLAAAGRDDEAAAVYERILAAPWKEASPEKPVYSPVASFNYARFLERHGRLKEALSHHIQAAAMFGYGERPRRALIACADRWWDGLSDKERYRRLRASLDEPDGPESLVILLRLYAAFDSTVSPSSICDPQSASQEFAAPSHSYSSPYSQRVALAQLAKQMEMMNMFKWQIIRHSPRFLKDRLASEFLSVRDPAQPRLIAAILTTVMSLMTTVETGIAQPSAQGFYIEPFAQLTVAPSGMALAPAGFGSYGGQIFVTNGTDDQVIRIDADGTPHVFANVSLTPRGIAFADGGPWGTTLYVNCHQDPGDTNNGKVVSIAADGAMNYLGRPNPVGGYLYGGVGIAASYGGPFGAYLYTGTGAGTPGDPISRFTPAGGTAALFHNFGNGEWAGSPTSLHFGHGQDGFTTNLYVGVYRINVPSDSGIFMLDSFGGASPVVTQASSGRFNGMGFYFSFGPGGSFGRKIYTGDGTTLTRVDANGVVEDFATGFSPFAGIPVFNGTEVLYLGSGTTVYRITPACPGDLNSDHRVDGLDIQPYVVCAVSGAGCNASDLDGDGQSPYLDLADDSAGFVARLLDGSPCP